MLENKAKLMRVKEKERERENRSEINFIGILICWGFKWVVKWGNIYKIFKLFCFPFILKLQQINWDFKFSLVCQVNCLIFFDKQHINKSELF